MDITVVIPVFNAQDYLQECLQSVFNQRFPGSVQVIAVNDGSTDSSGDILRNWSSQHDNLELIDLSHGGLATARNKGLDLAEGEWVTFVDADDKLLPGALLTMYEIAMQSGADIVVGSITRNMHELCTTDKFSELFPRQAILGVLYQNSAKFLGSACGKLFNKSLFQNIRFLDGLYYEDIEIMPKLFNACRKIAITDACVYYYRPNSGSFLSTWSDNRLDVLKVLGSLGQESFIAADAGYRRALADRQLSAAFNMLLLMDRLGVKNVVAQQNCMDLIKSNRSGVVLNSSSRFKNRVGAALSYLGMPMLKLINRCLKLV